MVYPYNTDRETVKIHEQGYHKLQNEDCDSPGPSYPEIWRQSPVKPDHHTRSPLELSINSYAVPSYDVEMMPNLLAFSPAGPPYKEYTVFKEKPTPEVTDALLSLKNAVVHPPISGQLSPLSPTMHLGPTPIIGAGGNCQSQQPLTYTVNHSAQVHPMGYSGRSSPQFPSVHAQFHGDPINTHGHQQQGMFPAMSVNVSMSMNVVPPNFANQYNPNQQWQSTPTQHYSMGQEYPHSPQATFQTQCSPYSQNYSYAQQYAFAPDFRAETRNFYYSKSHDDYKSSPRHYPSYPFKRPKSFLEEKPLHFPHSPESAKLNLCRICGKTYARPSTLKTHLRTHSGEKPYKCIACAKSFSQAANLTAHVRVHSGEKPFHCPVCDRHFSQSSSVTTHMRTHSGERPYRCRLCKKAFSDSSTLTKHLRIHSGEKPYQCKLCLLRFSQSGNLNRHMRVHSSTG